MVVANRGEDMVKTHKSIIVDETGIVARPQTKVDNARTLLDILEEKLK